MVSTQDLNPAIRVSNLGRTCPLFYFHSSFNEFDIFSNHVKVKVIFYSKINSTSVHVLV